MYSMPHAQVLRADQLVHERCTLINSSGSCGDQYVALRNPNPNRAGAPRILAHEIKVFFCKYNDPINVKVEKLELTTRLIDDLKIYLKIEQVLPGWKCTPREWTWTPRASPCAPPAAAPPSWSARRCTA